MALHRSELEQLVPHELRHLSATDRYGTLKAKRLETRPANWRWVAMGLGPWAMGCHGPWAMGHGLPWALGHGPWVAMGLKTCTRMCTCACVLVHTHACTKTHIHTRTRARAHTRTRAHARLYTRGDLCSICVAAFERSDSLGDTFLDFVVISHRLKPQPRPHRHPSLALFSVGPKPLRVLNRQ